MYHSPRLRHAYYLLILFVILLSFAPHGTAGEARPLILTDRQDTYDLLPHLVFWKDPQKELTIEQVAAPQNREHFNWRPGKDVNFGFSPSVYWARVTIESRALEDNWIITSVSGGIQGVDHLDLFVPDFDKGYSIHRDGEGVPYAQTMLPDFPVPAFSVDIPPGKAQTLYFRIEDEALLFLPLTLYTQQSVKSLAHLRFYAILVLGAFVFFLIYNILLYASLRDRIFLFFGLVMMGIPMFYFMSELGRFFPDLPTWWMNRIKPLGQLYYSAAWLFLIQQYFQVDQSLPKLNRPIWLAIIYCGGLGLMGFALPFHVWSIIKTWSMLCIFLSIVVLAVAGCTKGLAGGRSAVAAVLVIFSFAVFMELDILDIVSIPLLRAPEVRVFSLLAMLLLFSFALIDRYNTISRRTMVAQQKAVEGMQQAERTKDEFLANTSHELRTPLQGIIGMCEDILEKGSLHSADPSQEKHQIILHSARRLADLIDDLLNFSQIKRGVMKIESGPVAVEQVVKTVLALCRPMANEKKLRLASELPDKIDSAWADEGRVQQILLNLVKNAIKFTKTGEVRVSVKADDSHLMVSVKDTGIGIPHHQLALIFDRFRQLDGAMNREYGGLGLGLTISKQLVELQGGRIHVESEPGQGSVFSFTLPLANGHHTPPPPAPLESMPIGIEDRAIIPIPPLPDRSNVSADGQCILIVDDEPISLYTMHSYLETTGYQAITASDPLSVMEVIEHQSPDLVLLDIMMPHMDGYQLCRDIRLKYDRTELPVIMLTARTQSRDIVHGFECGANDYVAKPVHRQELLVRIQSTLKIKALTDLLRENETLKTQIIRRRKAEDELELLNRQLTQLLNLWQAGLVLTDSQGRIKFVNRGAESLFGCEAHQMVTQSLARILNDPTEMLHDFKRQGGWYAATQINPQIQYYQMQGLKADGDTPTQLEITSVPITFEGDNVYALVCTAPSASGDHSGQMATALARSQQKIQAMQATLDQLRHYIGEEARYLVDELNTIDQTAMDSFDHLPKHEIEPLYRQVIVETMNAALDCWMATSGRTKIDLAEKSRIWRAYLDNGTFKTRTLDKYLDMEKLPKNPRIGDVLKTVEFVCRHSDPNHVSYKALRAVNIKLTALMKARKAGQNRVKKSPRMSIIS